MIFLVRHGECFKNLVGIPGGLGASLTDKGKNEVIKLMESLKFHINSLQIWACPVVQTIETAQIIAKGLNIPLNIEDNLKSIYLGVLDGLPIEVASKKFPLASESMDAWRNGEIEINQINIEGMENFKEFYLRGLNILIKILSLSDDCILVCTTSWMIMIHNLFERKSIEIGGGYKTRSYHNAQLIKLDFSQNDFLWLKEELSKYSTTSPR